MSAKSCTKCGTTKLSLHNRKKYCFAENNKIQEKTTDEPVKQKTNAININEDEALKLLESKRACVLKKLIHGGINVNQLHYQNNPIIIWASMNFSHYLVKLLLKHGADPNSRCCDGKTALYYALKGGCFNVIDMLLKKGCDINETIDGLTYLYYAAMRFQDKIVEYLLYYGADPNIQTINGPLLFNLHSDHQINILKLLVTYKVNYNDSKNFRTAGEYFIQSDQLKLLNLFDNGCGFLYMHGKFNRYCKFEYKYYGRSLLHLAVRMKNFSCIVYLLASEVDFDPFRPDVNLCDACTGETPLHLAVRITGSVQLIELLLSHGAWLNVKDYQGNTPLDLAIKADNKDAIKCLELWKEIGKNSNLTTDHVETNIIRCYKMIRMSIMIDEDLLRYVRIAEKVVDQKCLSDLNVYEMEFVKTVGNELKEMKAFKLTSDISCFDLLHANKRMLAAVTIELNRKSKPLIELYYESLCDKFENCSILIWKKILLGVRYVQIFEDTVESLKILCKNIFPYFVTEFIIECLTVQDMENLIEAAK